LDVDWQCFWRHEADAAKGRATCPQPGEGNSGAAVCAIGQGGPHVASGVEGQRAVANWMASLGGKVTPRQLEILQHSLGLDQYGQGNMYRNHFCAGGDDEIVCRELVALGYMEQFTRKFLPYFNCLVTDAGKTAVKRESPMPPKLTRGQKNYRAFLDCDFGQKFGEWLKQKRTLDQGRMR
jgi:hypothetical protein